MRTRSLSTAVLRLRRQSRAEAGFTLIEVLISALLVGLIATAAAKALISTAHTSADQRLRSQADGLATQDQERLRGLSDESLASLNQSRQQTVSGTTFTVQSTSTYENTTGTATCSSTSVAYYRIVSTVTWTEAFTSQSPSITEDSLLSRPVTGDLLTQVTDQTGAALAGVTIAPNGPSPQTALSDSNGCVMFAGLTPGSYTVGLTKAGYVDPNGNSTASGPANVTTTGTQQPTGNPFHLGLAGSIVGTFASSPAVGSTAGEADGISWLGSLGSIPMSGGFQTLPKVDPTTPAAGYTTGSLFPFASTAPVSYTGNYTVWAGRCLGQRPPTGSPDQFTVIPGSTSTAQTIQEPLLDLGTVYYKSSPTASPAAQTPAHVLLTYSDSSGCNDSWRPPLLSAMDPTNGWLKHPGQAYAPAGTLTVCADYNGYKASQTTGNTSFAAVNVVPTITITQAAANQGTC